jgi:hypothetical protein
VIQSSGGLRLESAAFVEATQVEESHDNPGMLVLLYCSLSCGYGLDTGTDGKLTDSNGGSASVDLVRVDVVAVDVVAVDVVTSSTCLNVRKMLVNLSHEE